jgi:hypothetical protein
VLRIYDEFLEDETILGLKHPTYRLHVSALIYCSKNLTDGEVTEKAARVLQVLLGYPVKRPIAELVDSGVWVPLPEGGWRIRNYLEFNPDAETVKKERAKARKRMADLRKKRASSDEPSPERSPERDGERSHAVPNHTSPDQSFERPNPKAVTQPAAPATTTERPQDFTHIQTLIDQSLREAAA